MQTSDLPKFETKIVLIPANSDYIDIPVQGPVNEICSGCGVGGYGAAFIQFSRLSATSIRGYILSSTVPTVEKSVKISVIYK